MGKLRKIGGTADFRGMVNLTDLTPLKEIGGNLNLVNSLKGKYYGLNEIKVGGRIVYWNKEPTYYFIDSKKRISPIPVWENRGTYEFENGLVIPNREQLEYYNLFKKYFLKNEFLDIGGMRNYVRYLIYDLSEEYERDKNFNKLTKYFDTLRENYSEYANDCENIEVKIGRNLGIQKYIDYKFPHETYMSWDETIEILKEGSDERLKEVLKKVFVKNSNITNYGKVNIDQVLAETVTIIREFEKKNEGLISNLFFDQKRYYKTVRKDQKFDPHFYRKFYDTQERFLYDLNIHNERNKNVPEENIAFPKYFPEIVKFSLNYLINKCLREGENLLRAKNNLPKIGEGWISETELYYRLSEEFKNCEIVPQGRPSWLGLQRFDIYFPEYNIAIEYQGLQHFEPVEIFGGEEGFKKTLENDQRKKDLCKENNCTLIEVRPGYDFEELKKELAKLIFTRKNKSC